VELFHDLPTYKVCSFLLRTNHSRFIQFTNTA
jgi:hypothetical protein